MLHNKGAPIRDQVTSMQPASLEKVGSKKKTHSKTYGYDPKSVLLLVVPIPSWECRPRSSNFIRREDAPAQCFQTVASLRTTSRRGNGSLLGHHSPDDVIVSRGTAGVSAPLALPLAPSGQPPAIVGTLLARLQFSARTASTTRTGACEETAFVVATATSHRFCLPAANSGATESLRVVITVAPSAVATRA